MTWPWKKKYPNISSNGPSYYEQEQEPEFKPLEPELAFQIRENPEVIKEIIKKESPSEKEVYTMEQEALNRQYVVIIDKSGSMQLRDGNATRWDSAKKILKLAMPAIFKYDVDGKVPLYFFSDKPYFVGEVRTEKEVDDAFKKFYPDDGTYLKKVLKEAINKYAGKKRDNYADKPGTTLVVILDGEASDESKVYKFLKKCSNPKNGYIENHTQLAISFLQIGDDRGATAFLKRLDDNLEVDICDANKDDVAYQQGMEFLLYNAIFD